MVEDHPESPQRWTAKRRAALVLSIVKGETSAQAAARKHGRTVAEIEEWRGGGLGRAGEGARPPPGGGGGAEGEGSKGGRKKRRGGRRPPRITARAPEGRPLAGEAVGGVGARLSAASERRVCRVLGVSRATVRRCRIERVPTPPRLDPALTIRLETLIQQYPTFGYRRLWAWLRFREGHRITPKTVYRILALKGWFVHQRAVTPRPRAPGRISRAE